MINETTTLRSKPTDAELVQVLRPRFNDERTGSSRILAISRKPHAYSTSFALEALDLELDDGSHVELLIKDLSADALSDDAKRTRPGFLFDPARCVAVYEKILKGAGLGTAECLASRADTEAGVFWMILEKVPGTELWQIGEKEVWNDVARWAARMHAAYLDRVAELHRDVPLLVHDAEFYHVWPKRALEFLRARGDTGSDEMQAVERIASRYDRVAETLSALPHTLLHGELYPSNVIVQERDDGRRVCAIDWELSATGPGVIDLAALISGGWKEENRREMTEAYLFAWPESAGAPTGSTEFHEALSLSRLHIAMQWLGWASSWKPPREHAHDWLREAINLGDELGL